MGTLSGYSGVLNDGLWAVMSWDQLEQNIKPRFQGIASLQRKIDS